MNGSDGLMTPQGTMTGDSWFDQVIASFDNAVSGYFDSRRPVTPVPPPIAPATPQTDFMMLAIVGLVLYLVLK